MLEVLKLRPHHLLDIIMDYGRGITHLNREAHPYGAAMNSVTDTLLENRDIPLIMVEQVDSICQSCSQLQGDICQAKLSDDLLMRDYNDPLDRQLFQRMNLKPHGEISLKQFLEITQDQLLKMVELFVPPNIPMDQRLKWTRSGCSLLLES